MPETTTPPSPAPAAHAVPDGRTGPPLPRWVAVAFVVNLIAEIGIIVTGGLVRLTGSGLGCPTWPQCTPGAYAPVRHEATGYHIYIEFGNRLLTFVVALAALAVLAGALHLRRRRGRRGLVWPAVLLIAGILVQAVVGGVSVLVELHPAWVLSHFLVSTLLVALSVYLLVRLHEGDGPPLLLVPLLVRRVGSAAAAVGALVVVLGTLVTGSGPHSGDAERPQRLGLDPRAVSWLHADAVMLFVGLALAVWLAVHLTATARRPRRSWALVLLVTALQGVVGYTQYFTGLPEPLVLVHMLLAAVFVATLTNATLALRRRPNDREPKADRLANTAGSADQTGSGRWISGSTATATKRIVR